MSEQTGIEAAFEAIIAELGPIGIGNYAKPFPAKDHAAIEKAYDAAKRALDSLRSSSGLAGEQITPEEAHKLEMALVNSWREYGDPEHPLRLKLRRLAALHPESSP